MSRTLGRGPVGTRNAIAAPEGGESEELKLDRLRDLTVRRETLAAGAAGLSRPRTRVASCPSPDCG